MNFSPLQIANGLALCKISVYDVLKFIIKFFRSSVENRVIYSVFHNKKFWKNSASVRGKHNFRGALIWINQMGNFHFEGRLLSFF